MERVAEPVPRIGRRVETTGGHAPLRVIRDALSPIVRVHHLET
jgi:hypothetical protein